MLGEFSSLPLSLSLCFETGSIDGARLSAGIPDLNHHLLPRLHFSRAFV